MPPVRSERGSGCADGIRFELKMWVAFAIFWIVVSLFARIQRATSPSADPAPLTSFVSDRANVLDAETTAELTRTLDTFDKKTSNQIAVAIYPRLPSAILDDFTLRTAELSRLGTAAHDNGAILFVFVGERVARMEVGYGLEGALPDAKSYRILLTILKPAVAAGDYARGIRETVQAVATATTVEYRGRDESAFNAIRIAWKNVRMNGWTAIASVPIEGRLAITFFGSLFAMIFREAFAAVGALLLRRDGRRVDYGMILNAIKVLIFLVAIAQGIVLIAGGGAFGGAGGEIRW